MLVPVKRSRVVTHKMQLYLQMNLQVAWEISILSRFPGEFDQRLLSRPSGPYKTLIVLLETILHQRSSSALIMSIMKVISNVVNR